MTETKKRQILSELELKNAVNRAYWKYISIREEERDEVPEMWFEDEEAR